MISLLADIFIFSGVVEYPVEGFACEDCHLIRGLTFNCQLSIVNCQFSEALYQVVIAAGSHRIYDGGSKWRLIVTDDC